MTEPLIGNTAVFFFTCEMAGPSNENAIQFNEDRLASIVRSVYTALQGDTLDTNTGPLLVCRYLQETDLRNQVTQVGPRSNQELFQGPKDDRGGNLHDLAHTAGR